MANLERKPVPEISDAQEALLQASIANDPDNPEISEADFLKMRPASDVLPPALYAKLTGVRPKLGTSKVAVELWLDAVAVEAFKSVGTDWQSRMNDWLVHRKEVVDLVSTYEASLNAMRASLLQLKGAGSGSGALKPDQIRLIENIEGQLAVTATAALGVHEILKDQAILETPIPDPA